MRSGLGSSTEVLDQTLLSDVGSETTGVADALHCLRVGASRSPVGEGLLA